MKLIPLTYHILPLVVFSLLFSCQSGNQPVTTPMPRITPTHLTAVPTVLPTTVPSSPTWPLTLPSETTAASAATAIPAQAAAPTLPPIPVDIAYTQSLVATQYHLLETGVIWDSAQAFYALYVLQDSSVDPFQGVANSETCRLVFYRWQERQPPGTSPVSSFIASYPAPSVAGRDGIFPVTCQIINWDANRGWDYFAQDTVVSANSVELERKRLRLDGVSSDINANGLREFSVLYQFCLNACIDWGYVSAHFYEIQEDGSIRDITADLPGEVVPFFHLLHKEWPGTLLLYDLQTMSKWEKVETWWIYKWNGTHYQDATPEYAADIRQWGQDQLERIRAEYGSAIEWSRADFVAILLQYEKAGVQDEAMAILMEITDLIHWPGTEFNYRCWLKLLRATALDEYERGQPFSVPVSGLHLGEGENGYPPVCDDISET